MKKLIVIVFVLIMMTNVYSEATIQELLKDMETVKDETARKILKEEITNRALRMVYLDDYNSKLIPIIRLLEFYEEYEKECNADSSLVVLGRNWSVTINGKTTTEYWEYLEPTFQGYMEFLKKKFN